jgi:hypothetical protein
MAPLPELEETSEPMRFTSKSHAMLGASEQRSTWTTWLDEFGVNCGFSILNGREEWYRPKYEAN